MTTDRPNSPTGRQLLKALNSRVAQFYRFDLHVHSLGSYDVCQTGRFDQLPPELRARVIEALRDTRFPAPLLSEPAEPAAFDEAVAIPDLIQAYFEHLVARRDEIAAAEAIPRSNDWCVIGITDHNSATFACALSDLAWHSRTVHRVVILPGIELDVSFEVAGVSEQCHVHILCHFAPGTKASDNRCFFYITNDWDKPPAEIVFEANDRCNQENTIQQHKSDVRSLTAPVDTLVSNWAYMVMAGLAWSLKAWAALLLRETGHWKDKHRREKRTLLRMDFTTFRNAVINMPAQIVRGGRRIVYRLLSWNPWQTVFFRLLDQLVRPLRV